MGDCTIYRGTTKMVIPQGGAHVRSGEIRLPKLFNIKPTVSLTIYSLNNPGATFVLYTLGIHNLGTQTQIVFDATNTDKGVAIPDIEFYCDYMIMG